MEILTLRPKPALVAMADSGDEEEYEEQEDTRDNEANTIDDEEEDEEEEEGKENDRMWCPVGFVFASLFTRSSSCHVSVRGFGLLD